MDDSDENEDTIELKLGDASTIITGNRLKNIFNLVWTDNMSTMQVTYKTIMLIVYVKIMVSMGHTNELLLGILLGGIYHLLDLLGRLFGKVQDKFFDKDGKVNVESILTNKDKMSYKSLLTLPLITMLGLTFTKANIYTRLLGEWVVDMSMIYIYIGQILGYTLVQTFFNLIKVAKTKPMIVLLTFLYVVVAIFI